MSTAPQEASLAPRPVLLARLHAGARSLGAIAGVRAADDLDNPRVLAAILARASEVTDLTVQLLRTGPAGDQAAAEPAGVHGETPW